MRKIGDKKLFAIDLVRHWLERENEVIEAAESLRAIFDNKNTKLDDLADAIMYSVLVRFWSRQATYTLHQLLERTR